jgi:hypothetical protein
MAHVEAPELYVALYEVVYNHSDHEAVVAAAATSVDVTVALDAWVADVQVLWPLEKVQVNPQPEGESARAPRAKSAGMARKDFILVSFEVLVAKSVELLSFRDLLSSLERFVLSEWTCSTGKHLV